PLVERPSRGEVEAGVVPVAGENPVLERPAVERKAHVRAAVVDGEDGAVVGEQGKCAAVDVGDEAAETRDVVERGRANEGGGGGDHALDCRPRPQAAHRPEGAIALGLWTYSTRWLRTA